MGAVIEIKSTAASAGLEPRAPQAVAAPRKPPRFADEWHSHRALLRMFCCGMSFRAVGRLHPQHEDGFAREVRAAILAGEPQALRMARRAA